MIEVDLHIHTTFSDGSDKPAQIVDKAKELGLSAIAITDHDSMEGVKEAWDRGQELGLEVVPGVEINTDYDGTEVHILGYYPDSTDQTFCRLLLEQREARRKRAELMVTKLNELGLILSLPEVYKYSGYGTVGRPHIARVMMDRGYVNNIKEAFVKYIGLGGPAYIPRSRLNPYEAIHAIAKAHGVPVLAHPGKLNRDELISEFIKSGLMGIEAFHSDHDRAMSAHYVDLARKYNLIVTGGSDYHGPTVKPKVTLACAGTTYEAVKSLQLAKEKILQGD